MTYDKMMCGGEREENECGAQLTRKERESYTVRRLSHRVTQTHNT
jgi:hypothetical protein